MRLPLSYSFRNLWTRKMTTILTATGMALVVFVFAAVLMLAEGLKRTLVETGSPDNVVVVRRSADSEVVSVVQRSEAAIVETQPEIAVGSGGKPLVAREVMVLIALPKAGTKATGNVSIRGITEISLLLRPQVKLNSGRFIKPGTFGNPGRRKHCPAVQRNRLGRKPPIWVKGLAGGGDLRCRADGV